jgi:hypothetical protein
MNKKILWGAAAFIPLMILNGISLADGYFVPGDAQVNINIAAIFLVISLLISVTKLFFDFFVTLVTGKCVGLTLSSSDVLDTLLRGMLPQWLFSLVGLAITWLLFPGIAEVLEMVIFAASHTVYYVVTGVSMSKRTERKAFGYVYIAITAVCWIYAVCKMVGIMQM